MLRRLSILLATVAALALVPTRASAAPPTGWWTETTGSSIAVNGTYVPIVGDFAGGSTSDIIWYAPGSGTDYLWTSNGSGGFAKAPLARQINGTYTPIVGDFKRDGRDDLGIYRNGTWQIDTAGDLRLGPDDLTYQLGDDEHTPVVGDWDGDGRDQIGVVNRAARGSRPPSAG